MILLLVCLQTKRDILSETKYIELVLVVDHQEVSVCVIVQPVHGFLVLTGYMCSFITALSQKIQFFVF